MCLGSSKQGGEGLGLSRTGGARTGGAFGVSGRGFLWDHPLSWYPGAHLTRAMRVTRSARGGDPAAERRQARLHLPAAPPRVRPRPARRPGLAPQAPPRSLAPPRSAGRPSPAGPAPPAGLAPPRGLAAAIFVRGSWAWRLEMPKSCAARQCCNRYSSRRKQLTFHR